jgi:hypothetical protein
MEIGNKGDTFDDVIKHLIKSYEERKKDKT